MRSQIHPKKTQCSLSFKPIPLTEVSVQNWPTRLSVALGIPWNAEYPQKVRTLTSWNVL